MKRASWIIGLLCLSGVASCTGSGGGKDGGADMTLDINTGFLADGSDFNFVIDSTPQPPTSGSGPLTNRGVPSLPTYRMVVVYFDGPVPGHSYADEANYFQWLASGPYLSETIGQYGYHGPSKYWGYVDLKLPPSPMNSNWTDYQVQQQITGLINAGTVPQPDVTTIYFAMMGDGMTAQDPRSLGSTCDSSVGTGTYAGGWHGAFNFVTASGATQTTLYAVIGAPCHPGQLFGFGLPTYWYWMQAIVSHELSETITDSDPGKGWNDPGGQEVGDLCAGLVAKFSDPNGPFTPQLEFSNQAFRAGTPACVF